MKDLLVAAEEDILRPRPQDDQPSASLWWCTTWGSEYWPKTAEGRLLTFLLAISAFAIFGYITATIASHFVLGNLEAGPAPAVGEMDDRTALREEIVMLRSELAALATRLERHPEASRPTNGEHNQDI